MQHNFEILSPKNRRALSTVVSTAILMTGAALLGTMSLAWSTENLTTQQNNLLVSFNEKTDKLNEELLIENIWFGDGPPQFLNFTLSNTGTIVLNVTEVWVQNSTGKTITYYSDLQMISGNSTSRAFSFGWNPGEPTELTVFTNRGNVFTIQEVT